MDINAWLLRLNSWGFKDALAHPKTTVAIYVAFAILRWVAFIAGLTVAASVWMIFAVVAGLFRSR